MPAMPRDSLAALARGIVTVVAGAALIYALGWWTVVLIVVGAAWECTRWPGPWRWWT